MAQTNFTPIYLYNSGMANNTPFAANLGAGELAINYTDGKLFYKDNSSAIQVIGWKTTPTTAGGTGLTSYTAGDLPYYSSGTALSKLGIGTSGYVLESNGSAPTWVAQSTLSVGSATNATNTGTTDDTTTNAVMYPVWKTATIGNLPEYVSSTKFKFNPSTGTLTATAFSGSGASLTSIPNSALTNSAVTVGTTSISLGSSSTTVSGLTALNFAAAAGTNGITFNNNSTGVLNESLLNDYETGTFTPSFGGVTVTGTPVYTGTYTKIGRLVYVSVTVYINAVSTSFSATANSSYFNNLPFAVASGVANSQANLGASSNTIQNFGIGVFYPPNYGWLPTSSANTSGSYLFYSGSYQTTF